MVILADDFVVTTKKLDGTITKGESMELSINRSKLMRIVKEEGKW